MSRRARTAGFNASPVVVEEPIDIFQPSAEADEQENAEDVDSVAVEGGQQPISLFQSFMSQFYNSGQSGEEEEDEDDEDYEDTESCPSEDIEEDDDEELEYLDSSDEEEVAKPRDSWITAIWRNVKFF